MCLFSSASDAFGSGISAPRIATTDLPPLPDWRSKHKVEYLDVVAEKLKPKSPRRGEIEGTMASSSAMPMNLGPPLKRQKTQEGLSAAATTPDKQCGDDVEAMSATAVSSVAQLRMAQMTRLVLMAQARGRHPNCSHMLEHAIQCVS